MGHLMVSISLKKMKTFLALLALGFFDLGLATTTPTPTTTTTTTTTTATTTTTDDSGNTNRPFMLCSYAKNDIGTCECPGQFFIADECHKGFFCMDFSEGNYPEGVNNNYD